MSTDAALHQRSLHVDSRVVVRLRPGVDSTAAVHSLSAFAAHLAESYPAEFGGWRSVAFLPSPPKFSETSAPSCGCSPVAAVFVLLIACVNIADLSLARASARSRELAIRAALGGKQTDLVRLLAAECFVLAAAAGTLGLGAAFGLVRWIKVIGQGMIPRVGELAVDGRFVILAILFAVVTVIILGLLPALGQRVTLIGALKDGSGTGRGPFRRRLRATLVVGEFALALMLLAGAGLLCEPSTSPGSENRLRRRPPARGPHRATIASLRERRPCTATDPRLQKR